MKNWIIKKKPRSDTTSDQPSKDKNIGGVNSVFAPPAADISENAPALLSPRKKTSIQRSLLMIMMGL
jgi:hypothetical protein